MDFNRLFPLCQLVGRLLKQMVAGLLMLAAKEVQKLFERSATFFFVSDRKQMKVSPEFGDEAVAVSFYGWWTLV